MLRPFTCIKLVKGKNMIRVWFEWLEEIMHQVEKLHVWKKVK
ncbi:hypothetical protein Hanom_Chr06g00549011 [Helianthus anomalus]